MSTRFGKYELLARIGVGGMAEVFHARTFGAEGFVKDVVIKRILPAFTEDPDFVDMFVKEARLAVRLNHANIVQVLDFDHVEGHYYIAMEHVDGPDLRRIETVARRRSVVLPQNLAIHVAVEALKGLHYAHTRDDGGRPLGIVHRDISPHNLLVSYSGEVKVADFGIAKVAALASGTRPGSVKGKLTYMSPEQIRGLAVDHRSDLFSLGIVLWELLSGRRLYADCGSEGEIIAAVQRAEIPRLGTIDRAIPEPLQAVVERLLQPDPENRCPSAAVALAELSPLAGAEHALEVGELLRGLLPEGAQREHRGQTEVVTRHAARKTGPDEPTRTSDPRAASVSSSDPSLQSGRSKTPGAFAQHHADTEDSHEGGIDQALPLDTGPQRQSSPVIEVDSNDAGDFDEEPEPQFDERLVAGRRALVVGSMAVSFGVFAALAWWGSVPVVGGTELKRAAPAVRAGRVVVRSEPAGAEVFVDGLSLGREPVLDLVAPAAQRLRLEGRSGKQRAARYVTVEAEREREVVLRLDAADGESFATAASVANTRQPLAQPRPRATRAKRQTLPPSTRTTPAPVPHRAARSPRRKGAASAQGRLDVVVSPWAAVELDGQPVGIAPIKGLAVPAGRHRLRLSNHELGKDEQINVLVRPKGTTRIRRDWLEE